MIAVQSIVDLMKFELDAEGSDRYLFDLDFKPAINQSVKWLVSVFNSAMERNKLSAEDLQDLIRTRVWTASTYSRVNFDEVAVGHKLWSILSVHPKPNVFPVASTPTALPNNYASVFESNVAYTDGYWSAKKLTIEQWDDSRKNVFEAGNELLVNGLKSYAYKTHINYDTTSSYAGGKQIEIRPTIAGNFVAITYLKYPEEITLITDDIELPETLTTLVTQKALNFISIKQGDQTSLYGVTETDVNRLIQIMS